MDTALAAVVKALADDTRLDIVTALAESGELSCGELMERCTVGQSTVSHHVKVLAEAGVVEVRPAGQRSLHRLVASALEEAAATLVELAWHARWGGWSRRRDPAAGLPDIGPGNVD